MPDKQIINFINALALPVHQGGLLICGDSLNDVAQQLSSTVEITTKILYAVQSKEALLKARNIAFNDIRVAVHQQDIASFMQDVKQNMFNVIVIEAYEELNQVIETAKEMITPNGYIVIVEAKRNGLKLNLNDVNAANWCLSHLDINGENDRYSLTVLTPQVMKKQQRTGRGRKRRAMHDERLPAS